MFKVTAIKLEKPSGWEAGDPDEQEGRFHGYMWPIFSYRNPKQPAGFLLGCPECGRVGSLSEYDVKVIDGEVTVNPSIKCGYEDCDAHYWVVDGKIQ